MSTLDLSFASMGSEARLVIAGDADLEATAARCRAFLADFEARLSRFRRDSELVALNTAPGEVAAASPLLRAAVRAGLWGARRTNGLVDPTLVGAIEEAGYDHTRSGPELPLAEALREAPPRAAARPDPRRRWADVVIDAGRGCVRRPPGLRFDTGGTGKGLAADLLAGMLVGCDRWAADCGGDLRVGSAGAAAEPFAVEVAHPLTGACVHTLELRRGAVATSGLDVHVWRRADGMPAHHLLDPGTGEPAWTGLVGATALAPTALEAEVRAKAALLSGPAAAAPWLARHGGLVVRDDGAVERFGRLAPHAIVRMPGRMAA
jgi:thiamine biosynthesis lipoprotein